LPTFAGPNKTQAALAIVQLAIAWTDIALQTAIGKRVPMPAGKCRVRVHSFITPVVHEHAILKILDWKDR
jgi:hypothetical protein